MKRREIEAGQHPVIGAADRHALDGWARVFLEPCQAAPDIACKVQAPGISGAGQISHDLERGQGAQPGFLCVLSQTVLARGPGAGPVPLRNAQPVRYPSLPMRALRKLRDGKALKEAGRALSQACEASPGPVARAIRPAINLHVRSRTSPSTPAGPTGLAFSAASRMPCRSTRRSPQLRPPNPHLRMLLVP